jgi:threonine dehydratase
MRSKSSVEVLRGWCRLVRIAEAMRIYFDDTHQIAEGAAAAPLAALLQQRQQMANKRVGLIMSGGNIERARLLQVLEGRTPGVG